MCIRRTAVSKIIYITSIAIVLWACGAGQEADPEPRKKERLSDAKSDWQDAYLNYLDELDEYADSCTYSLIYVDEDDIPELVTDTGISAGGCQILTFHNGSIDELQTMRQNFTY